MKALIKLSIVLGVVLVLVLGTDAEATVVVDGRFDPTEGYDTLIPLSFTVEGVSTVVTGGELRLHQDLGSGDLYLLFTQPLTLVDNTYGANSIGWGLDAPSGKNHSFKDLKGSDKAQFQFTDGLGNLLLDVTMDYISETSRGSGVYDCLGVTGGDGKVTFGPGSAVTQWASSLDYNFNVLGFVLTGDSPATDNAYTENPSYPGWLFDVTYEMCVSGSLFEATGFGDVRNTVVHDSPNKIGKNRVWSKIPTTPPIPEPISSVLFAGSVLLGLGARRLRKFRA